MKKILIPYIKLISCVFCPIGNEEQGSSNTEMVSTSSPVCKQIDSLTLCTVYHGNTEVIVEGKSHVNSYKERPVCAWTLS